MGAFSEAWAGHVRKMDHEAIVGFIGALRDDGCYVQYVSPPVKSASRVRKFDV
jgi:hypothetical protein